ncbi:hypothetical protein Tco_0277996 [Tanacetum coccineum]
MQKPYDEQQVLRPPPRRPSQDNRSQGSTRGSRVQLHVDDFTMPISNRFSTRVQQGDESQYIHVMLKIIDFFEHMVTPPPSTNSQVNVTMSLAQRDTLVFLLGASPQSNISLAPPNLSIPEEGAQNDNDKKHQDNDQGQSLVTLGWKEIKVTQETLCASDTEIAVSHTPNQNFGISPMKERILDTSSRPRALPIGNRKDERQFFGFHNDHEHETKSCRELKKEIEKAINQGKLDHLLQAAKKKIANAPEEPTSHICMIPSTQPDNLIDTNEDWLRVSPRTNPCDAFIPSTDLVVISVFIASCKSTSKEGLMKVIFKSTLKKGKTRKNKGYIKVDRTAEVQQSSNE